MRFQPSLGRAGGRKPIRTGLFKACIRVRQQLSRKLPLALLICSCIAFPAAGQEATLVLDAGSGEILYGYRQDDPLHPASLTKMMTLYMAFEALKKHTLEPDQPLTVSREAASQPRSRLGLKEGTTITTADAILALITKSANDASVVLAEAIADFENDFARAMTRKSRDLGMVDTIFRNASGLHDDEQVTTARDMGKLAMALLEDFPEYYDQFSVRSFSWHGRRYGNHNPLLSSYEGADGIKTGYIRQSGYNLVGSAERDGRRIIAVVMGSKTPRIRDWTITTLLDFGFKRLADGPKIEKSATVLPYIANPHGSRALTTALLNTVSPRSASSPAQVAFHSGLRRKRPPDANAGNDEWGVQIGAYPSPPSAEEAVRQAKERLPRLLGQTRLSLPAVDRGGVRFYRARLVGLSETEARSACRQLADHRIPCLAVGENGAFRTSLAQ